MYSKRALEVMSARTQTNNYSNFCVWSVTNTTRLAEGHRLFGRRLQSERPGKSWFESQEKYVSLRQSETRSTGPRPSASTELFDQSLTKSRFFLNRTWMRSVMLAWIFHQTLRISFIPDAALFSTILSLRASGLPKLLTLGKAQKAMSQLSDCAFMIAVYL